jgi:hypothetical protein
MRERCRHVESQQERVVAAHYIVAIVVAFGVVYAFYFLLLRHWLRAARGRNASREHRELRAAERTYEKQIEDCKETIARLSRVAEPNDPTLIEARAELDRLVRSRDDSLYRAFAEWDSREQK